MSQSIQCVVTEGIRLFGGAMFLNYLQKVTLTDAQYQDPSVQTAQGQGKIVPISPNAMVDIRGDFPVKNSDTVLAEGENISADTSQVGIVVTLFPNAIDKSGSSHLITPAMFSRGQAGNLIGTWETNNVQLMASAPIQGDAAPYYLDISVPCLVTFVGGQTGWRVVPLT